MAQPYYQPGPNASPQYPNENQPRPQYQQGGRDVGSYPPPRQQMQLAPHDSYGQAPPIGYQAPPTGYPTPPIGEYSRSVQQHVYGEERRGAPLLVPRSQLPQHDRGFGEEMRPPQNHYRTVPSQDQYRTEPIEDQYRTEPIQDQYRTVPSQDQYRTVHPQDHYRTAPSQDHYHTQPEHRPPVPRHTPNDVQEERRRQEEARRQKAEYGGQEPREYQEPGTMHGMDRRYESSRDHLRPLPSSMQPGRFQRELQSLHPIRYEPEYTEPSRGMETERVVLDRRLARQDMENRMVESIPRNEPQGFVRRNIDLAEERAVQPMQPIRYEPEYTEPRRGRETERVVLDRGLARHERDNRMVESIPRNEPRGFARGNIHLDEDQEQYSDPRLNNRPPSSIARSSSPDYWTMAKENGRGNEQWLRKMILSVLNAHSTVAYEERNLKMITVEHLSKLIHSYDTGKELQRGFRYDDVIGELIGDSGRQITWLDFLREMRDEGLVRIHEAVLSGPREYVIYAPFDTVVAPFANTTPFTD